MTKVWKPVETGTLHTWDAMCHECMDVIQVSKAYEYVDGPRQLLTVSENFGEREASVYMPDNFRLCQLVDAPPTLPDEVKEAIEELRALVVALVATSRGNDAGTRYIEAARTVRAWLDAQPKENT